MSRSISPFVTLLLPAMFLAPALTCVSPRSMAATFIISMVAALMAHYVPKRRLPQVDWWLAAVLGAVTCIGLLSTLWSIIPDASLRKAWQLLVIFGLACLATPVIRGLSRDDLKVCGAGMLAGCTLGMFIYLSEMHSNFFLYDLVREGNTDSVDVKQNKPIVMLSLWLCVAAPFVWFERKTWLNILFGVLTVLLVYITFTSGSQTAQILLPGLAVFVAVLRFLPARLCLHLALAGLLGLTVMAPVMASTVYKHTPWLESKLLNNTIKIRIEIWNQASHRIEERPVLGWGLNATPRMPNRGERSLVYPQRPVFQYLHLHNAPIHIWFELGMVGVFFGCMLFVLLWQRLKGYAPLAMKFGVFATVTTFLFTLTIWGIWQTWFIAMLAFVALLFYAGVRYTQERTN